MSGITLSSSVRQNLLSLQSTADLLSTTQSRLSTGNKVNSALDNPTNFFTAQSLNNRASDINNLLDGIGNGVQVIQAANTGITSLQKLVDSAKSIANQALQATVGYTKSSASSAASTGITANDLLGTTAAVTNSSTGTQLQNNVTATFSNSVAGNASVVASSTQAVYVSATADAGGELYSASATAAVGGTLLSALKDSGGTAAGIADGDKLVVNGRTITFATGSDALDGSGTAYTMGIDTSLDDLKAAINTLQGGGAAGTYDGTAGKFTLASGTDANLSVSGTAAAKLGLTGAAATATRTGGGVTAGTITNGTKLSAATADGNAHLGTAIAAGDTLTVNDKTISFFDSSLTSGTNAAGTDPAISYIDVATKSVSDVLSAIDNITGTATPSSVSTGGKLIINTGTTQDLKLGGTALSKLGLPTPTSPATQVTTARLSTPATAPAITGATKLSGVVGTDALQTGFAAGDAITVNGTTINFVASGATGNDVNITDDVTTLLGKINTITGGTSSVANGKLTISSGTASDITLADNGNTAGSVLAKLGLKPQTIAKSEPIGAGISGKTLTIGKTGANGTALNITFGTGDGQVSTLDQLNAKLATNNMQATINTSGQIKLTTTNDAASSDIGVIGGTITDPGQIFSGVKVDNAVADPDALATRASFVSQFNQVIDNIKTTAQDSSFNGINLLNGDTLSLTFNETGKSKLDISGVNFSPDGLGLSSLTTGTDFIDNASTNKILDSLNKASTSLRSQASAFGSNLSIVQMRQDFSKNLINVLQTGASNLTLADTNEEAANSQALSTRQSIAVSALSLANQSQQGVLQLLR